METANLSNLAEQAKREKWMKNLQDDMKHIIPFLEDKRVTDIAIAAKGEVIIEGIGMGKQFTGIFFEPEKTLRVIKGAAAILGVQCDEKNPAVEGVLPKWKCRIEGIISPFAVNEPMLFIRRPSEKIFTLEEYVKDGRLSQERYDLLLSHIKNRSNIVVGGETGSGKTTLLNAIIAKMAEFTPNDRFYIVEDAGEIQCRAKDVVPIYAAGKETLKAVGIALRCNVSRIIFGELRYGDVANEVLKAWNTGHTGNATTIHADSCMSMISRIQDLLREVIVGQLPDISQSVQLLIHLIPTENGPVVNEIVETKSIQKISVLDKL